MKKITVCVLSVFLIMGFFVSCDSSVVEKLLVSIKIKPDEITIYIGETANLSAESTANKKITWTSSDSSVVTVDENGNITGKSAGKATITAKSGNGGKTAKCSVTVIEPSFTVTFDMQGHGQTQIVPITVTQYGAKISKPTNPTDIAYTFGGWYKNTDFSDDGMWDFDNDVIIKDTTLYAKWIEGCLAAGTMITMADGSRQAVETLKTGDMIRTFDHESGMISSAPIDTLWIIENCLGKFVLHFSGGIEVAVVQEHCFFDKDTNKYEVLTYKNASQYIGHHFYNGDKGKWEKLRSVEFSTEPVTAYYVFTAKHFNHMANGMLSLDPLDDNGFTYVFDFGDNLKFDEAKVLADIKKYGLMTREEMPYVPYDYFEALNMKYLKVAYGKGLAKREDMEAIIRSYI